jgi:AcrR family transcriptional regulator
MVTSRTSVAEISRRDRRSNEIRDRLLKAALQLFAEKGYVNTTVEEITALADVAKGTFFNYFQSKEHVFFALTEIQRQHMLNAVAAAKDAQSVKPVILQFAQNIAAGPGRSPLMLRSMLGTAFLHEAMINRLSELLNFGRGEIAKIMRRGQELGEIRTDYSPEELARALQRVMFGTNAIWAICKDRDLASSVTASIELFWRGIRKQERGKDEES